MKNLFRITVLGILLIFINSCTTKNAAASEKTVSLLRTGEFTFMAQRANPMGNDVTNVLNSLPNPSASRILDLDYGYTLKVTKSEITSALPYFGRVYVPNYNTEKNGYRFTSKDFQVAETAGKKGSTVYNFRVNDQNIRKMFLEVFPNGKAYLNIDSNDRQPISYDGYITENKE